MKIYFTDNLKINILIKTDMFISYKFLLNYASQFVIIDNYQNVKIFIYFMLKSYS